MPLLIIDDPGMRKLPHTAAEDLLEIIMRRHERASTLLTSNRPADDWDKLLADTEPRPCQRVKKTVVVRLTSPLRASVVPSTCMRPIDQLATEIVAAAEEGHC